MGSALELAYRERYQVILNPLAQKLEDYLRDLFKQFKRVDRIGARAKAIDRFLQKAGKQQDGKTKYAEPLEQIQDQIGARIIVFYLCDVDKICACVDRYFRKIESQTIVPDSEAEFGYFGKHFVLFLPSELFDADIPADKAPKFFELQVKTLFQHAWAEANHDLAYKPLGVLSGDDKRKIAFTAAQAWGADRVFSELFTALGQSVPKNGI